MRNEIEKLNRERDHLADVIKAQGESAVVFGCKLFVMCEGTLLLYFLFFPPFPPSDHLSVGHLFRNMHPSLEYTLSLAFARLCIINVLCIRVTVFCLVFDVFSL